MTIKEFAITVGVVLSLVFYVAVMYHGCKKPMPPTDAVKLLPDETDKITTSPSTIIVARRKPDGTTTVHTQPNYGHGTVVTRRTDGTLYIKARELGNSNDFGLSTDFKGIGVGTEFLYYRNLSLLGGSHFINMKDSKLQLHLYVGVGYRIPHRKINNVSVFAGFDTERRVIGGLFLRIGNS